MISFNQQALTYTCPYCGLQQAFQGSYNYKKTCYSDRYIVDYDHATRFTIYTIRCTNKECRRICVVGINEHDGHQVDIMPQHVFRRFPEYIPQAIRADYEEACQIITLSPKAAATLLRRCLQGMIRDFHGIKKGRLIDEIAELQGHIPPFQWNAIDSLRKLGNIGAHMEKDVNLIIDIEIEEAGRLLQLVEMLFAQWYINRHDQEELCAQITATADSKEAQRQARKS